MRKAIGISLWVFLIFSFSPGRAFSQSDTGYWDMLDKLYQNSVPQISPEVLKANLSDFKYIVLDARELPEYEVSHLPGAIFVGYRNFSLQNIASIPKEYNIVVYCSVGYRSERIGEELMKHGYQHVFNLRGGIFEWAALQYKLVDTDKNEVKKVHPYNKRWSKWVRNCEIAYE